MVILFIPPFLQGSPVNRIPIMAKHVLDLYELYKLVIAKGGLVEVINKKLWREITKGLNLPSSITSAAFTLRTQYMKYLYPYECEKLKLSSPQELQTAIDGNRREGRRPAYGFDYASPNGMSSHGPNGLLLSHPQSQSTMDLLAPQHQHHTNPHAHHAFLAAAAAAAAVANHSAHQPQAQRPPLHLQHPLFDPTNLNVNTNHLSHYQMQAAVAAAAASPGNIGIPSFLKPYLDLNNQSSAQLHSREGLIMEANNNNNNNNMHNQSSDDTNNHYNRHLGNLQKRNHDAIEQPARSDEQAPEVLTNSNHNTSIVNRTTNEALIEPPAKRILTEQQQNSNKNETKITKIKVLPNKGNYKLNANKS